VSDVPLAVVNVQQAPKALSFGGDAASSALFRHAYVVPADSVAGTHVVDVPYARVCAGVPAHDAPEYSSKK
jgi:hypothetical protein